MEKSSKWKEPESNIFFVWTILGLAFANFNPLTPSTKYQHDIEFNDVSGDDDKEDLKDN